MPAVMIVLPMGGGKTGATLTAVVDLLAAHRARRILVIGPLLVAKTTWPDEVGTWAHTNHLDYAVCVGTELQRKAALDQRATITFINRENLPWLWDTLAAGEKWDFDTVVVDEASMFKGGKKRTTLRKLTRFGVLAQARKKIKRIVLLTGTPAPNGLVDLWGPIYLLDQGQRLGRTRTAFLNRWFDVDRYSYKTTPKAHAEKEIMAAIGDVMIALPPAKLVDDPIIVPVYVDLPKKVRDEYKRFERTMVADAYDVEAVSRGVLTNKLLQAANGSLYKEDGSVVPVHDGKLKALDDLVEQAQGENLLVFYSYKFDLDRIRARYPDAVVLNESDTAVADWNAGKIKMLLAHPASCAHGLNLQAGGHIMIWYGLTWSLELYQQACARLPRPGQQHQVMQFMILTRGTVDEKIMVVCADRGATQDRITQAVRAHLLES